MSGIVSELPESLEVFDGDNGAEDVQRSLLQRDLDDSSQENEVASVSIHNFDCQLCLSLLCEPVTIACGHTFCRVCIIVAIERSKSRCPVCRTPCHTCAKGRVVNVLLATLIKTYWPKQYAQRLEEGKQTIQSWKYKIPLFCFNEVLFPGQPYRLHFFEPRYKLMMERCLEGNREFGFFPSYSLTPGAVGTIAEVIECEFLADGRCLVLIEGRSRFRIQEHWVEESTEGLNYARIELFDDSEPEANDSIHETAQQVESRLTEYLGNLPVSKYSELIDFLGEIPSGQPKMLSMWVSSFLPASPSFKLELLSKTSTSQRLMEVLQSLILILQISSSHVNYLSSPDSPQ